MPKGRKKYLNTNKYQRQIVSLAIVPSLVISILVTVLFKIFYRGLIDVLLSGQVSQSVQFINQWSVFILVTLWTFFVCIVIWSYAISLNLVGAFERIFKELDAIIDGKDKQRIVARPKDDLANALLKRINILIANLPKPRGKLSRK